MVTKPHREPIITYLGLDKNRLKFFATPQMQLWCILQGERRWTEATEGMLITAGLYSSFASQMVEGSFWPVRLA